MDITGIPPSTFNSSLLGTTLISDTHNSLHSADDKATLTTMMAATGSVVSGILIIAVLLTFYFKPCRPRCHSRQSHSAKRCVDEERGLSKQIVQMDQFRVLNVSHDSTPLPDDTPLPNLYDVSPSSVASANITANHSELTYTVSDYTYNIDQDFMQAWDNEADMGRVEDTNCRSWLLARVHRLEVIEEEPEDVSGQSDMGMDSPRSDTLPCEDSISFQSFSKSFQSYSKSFQSCSKSFHSFCKTSSHSDLNTAFSESTNSGYKTCSENPHPQQINNTLIQTPRISPGHGEYAVEPSSEVELALEDHVSERSCTPPASDPSTSTDTNSTRDNSDHSGTSGEVSSSCFDLSYVTFYSLPVSTEDSSLQAVYACFDPSQSRDHTLTSPKLPFPCEPEPYQHSLLRAN